MKVSTTDRRSIDIMVDEIGTIPDVIADQSARLRAPLRALADEIARPLPEVVLTGCGDSHFAGVGAKLALERDAGVRCQVLESLELTRYAVRYVPLVPRPPLLVAISYSGSVGRTIEAASTARGFGWRVVALTGRPDGRLAQVAEPVLMDVPTLGFSPGTSTYVAMLTALYTLAGELAAASGRKDGAERAYAAIQQAPELARETIRLATEPAQRAAECISAIGTSTFIGSGPHRASAEFGAAKLFEGAQRYGVAQQLEEWAHEQYFVSGPATPIVVVAPSGAARDRAGELLAEMAFIGAPSVLVSDVVDDAVARSASIVLPIARGLDEAYSPLLTCLPLALMAFYLAEGIGTTSYGFPSPAHEVEHYATIHRATRREPA
jgi:glucosamine 6-phosphate synthetase-like amidotransferase/phosphosugar isomerase protein